MDAGSAAVIAGFGIASVRSKGVDESFIFFWYISIFISIFCILVCSVFSSSISVIFQEVLAREHSR